jgi:hypothetical protein
MVPRILPKILPKIRRCLPKKKHVVLGLLIAAFAGATWYDNEALAASLMLAMALYVWKENL